MFALAFPCASALCAGSFLTKSKNAQNLNVAAALFVFCAEFGWRYSAKACAVCGFFSFSPEVRGKDFAMRKIYILAVKALNLPGRIYL